MKLGETEKLGKIMLKFQRVGLVRLTNNIEYLGSF